MLAGTIGAAIIVGVLGLPPTAITWCVLGEPMTYQTNNKVNNYSLRVIFRPSFLKWCKHCTSTTIRSFELSKNKHWCKYKAKYKSNIIEQGTLGRPTSFHSFHFCRHLWCLKSEMRTHSSYSPTCVVLLLKPRHQKIGRKEFQGFFTSLTGTTDNITSSWNNSTITFQEINFACPFSWTM